MGVSLHHGSNDDFTESADINITPFIDVILVLLIIFMVAAPLSTVDIAVELPSSAAPQQQRPDKPVFISLKSDLSTAVGEDIVPREKLAGAIDAAVGGKKEERIYLRADKGVSYGDLMALMNILRKAGFLKIGLVGLEDVGASSADGAP